MPAHVLVGPHRALAVSHDGDRNSARLRRQVGPGLGHVAAEGDHVGLAGEPPGPLGTEVGLVGVMGSRDPGDLVGQHRPAGGVEREDLAHQLTLDLGPHQDSGTRARLVHTKDTAWVRSKKPSSALKAMRSSSLGK